MFTVLSTVFLLGTLVRAAPIQLDWLLDPLAMSSDIDAIIPTSTTPAAAGVDTTSFLEVTVTQTVLATVSTTSVASYIPLTSTIVPSPTTTASEAASTAAGTLSIPSSLAAGNDKIVAAYYPDWAGPNFPPEKIDFARFDWIDFAFALPNAQFGLEWDNEDGTPALLRRLVTAAHAKGKKVKLSVGGWTGSKYFSPAIASADSRLVFANSILGVYEEFKLDGIDIDYEYPSQEGAAGNLVDAANDTANFLAFLQLLRGVLPTSAKITAAALSRPWAGPDGAPLADVRAFAAVLDWILVMNYDVWGSSAAPGPNAPLADACGNSTQPAANAHTAVQAWSAAGLPPHQITLGLPAYGYLSRSAATSLRGRARKVHAADAGPALTLVNGDGGADNGQVQFRALVAQGALVRAAPGTGGPAFAGAHGFERRWDACSATPFLRSEAAGQVVTYDDPESLALKARFAADAGLRGVNMFDVHGDTDRWDLIDAARAGLYGN